MSIIATYPLTYWNYFLTLESDLANLSRFVEFSPDNFGTYSVEMARLLLASGSEVDVVLRQLCSVVAPDERIDNVETYRRTLESVDPSMATVTISLPRFGLELTPWESWLENRSPDWWVAHNKVKHERGTHFPRANLKNVLNAMGGLFVAVIYYYRTQAAITRLAPVPQLFWAPRELIGRAHSAGGDTSLYYERAKATS